MIHRSHSDKYGNYHFSVSGTFALDNWYKLGTQQTNPSSTLNFLVNMAVQQSISCSQSQSGDNDTSEVPPPMGRQTPGQAWTTVQFAFHSN